MAKTTLNLRVDGELKKEAEKVIGRLGISMSGAIVLFLNALVRENGIPFEIKANDKNKRKSRKSTANKATKKAAKKQESMGKDEEQIIANIESIKAALRKL